MLYKERIASRAALEVRPGQVINLGIGIPTMILSYLPEEMPVWVHSENGILGMGPRCERGAEDRNLIDAGGAYVTVRSGAAFVDSALSFALVRGGRLDIAFLGALEISERGDLANWIVPGKFSPGIGGGMELAQKARRVIVTTTHTTRDGKPKILKRCSLPLTAASCVDMIITELAVLEVREEGLFLAQLMPEATVEEVAAKTGAELAIPDSVPLWRPSPAVP
jgi:3-oxoacid CoA-transferase B subunit